MGEFDKELEDYLSARRKPGLRDVLKSVLPHKPKQVSIPEDVQVYHEEKARKPFFERLKLTKRSGRDEELVDDMKEIAKIALVAIKQLPDAELSAFKKGPDFERLKELLKKHRLIR